MTSSLSNSRRHNKATAVSPKEFHGISHLNRFDIKKKLGEGTFGIVYEAQIKPIPNQHNQSNAGNLVAIKRILQRDIEDQFPVTAFRELAVLKRLKNDNIVELVDVIVDKPLPMEEKQDMTSKLGKSFYLVFPYMSYDLTGILQSPGITLKETDNKSIMKQMLEGLDYMHSKGYLHRDIKASNILISHSGLLKIGDFGLARNYKGTRATRDLPGGGRDPMTEVVMTRWYRAPEVLMGNRKYTTAVDLWACGCILGELYEKKPILRGKSDLDQAQDIFALIGEPNSRTMPGFETLKMTLNLRIEHRTPLLRSRFGDKMSNDAVHLLENLLVLDHTKRYTALRALEHDWFKSDPLPTDRVATTFPECHESDVINRRQQQPKSKSQPAPPVPQHQQHQQQQHQQHQQHPQHPQHQPQPSNIPKETIVRPLSLPPAPAFQHILPPPLPLGLKQEVPPFPHLAPPAAPAPPPPQQAHLIPYNNGTQNNQLHRSSSSSSLSSQQRGLVPPPAPIAPLPQALSTTTTTTVTTVTTSTAAGAGAAQTAATSSPAASNVNRPATDFVQVAKRPLPPQESMAPGGNGSTQSQYPPTYNNGNGNGNSWGTNNRRQGNNGHWNDRGSAHRHGNGNGNFGNGGGYNGGYRDQFNSPSQQQQYNGQFGGGDDNNNKRWGQHSQSGNYYPNKRRNYDQTRRYSNDYRNSGANGPNY